MGNGHRKHRNDASYTEAGGFKYDASLRPNRMDMDMEAHTLVPYAHVDSTLRSLAGQAQGFGRFAVGGLRGSVYCVTTLAGQSLFFFFFFFFLVLGFFLVAFFLGLKIVFREC